jgi:hypothetical protein
MTTYSEVLSAFHAARVRTTDSDAPPILVIDDPFASSMMCDWSPITLFFDCWRFYHRRAVIDHPCAVDCDAFFFIDLIAW